MLHVSGTPGTPNIPLSHEISGVCSSNLVDVLLPSGILATYPEPVCLKARQLCADVLDTPMLILLPVSSIQMEKL